MDGSNRNLGDGKCLVFLAAVLQMFVFLFKGGMEQTQQVECSMFVDKPETAHDMYVDYNILYYIFDALSCSKPECWPRKLSMSLYSKRKLTVGI